MKRFIDLSTRAKLIIAFGSIWLLLAVVIGIAYRNITMIAQSGQKMHDMQFKIAMDLLQLRSSQNYNHGQILEMMLTDDKSQMKKNEENINQRTQEINKIIEGLGSLDLNEDSRALLDELEKQLTAYRQTRDEKISLIEAGKSEDAQELAVSVQNERFENIRSIAVKLGDIGDSNVHKQLELNNRAAGIAKMIFIIAAVAAFLLGGVVTFFMNKTTADPLRKLTDLASAIAEGDLDVSLKTENRGDEVGSLIQSFSRMTETLREFAVVAMKIADGDLRGEINPRSKKDVLGNAFNRMVSNLRKMMADINGTVNMLSSSASEILAATTQVSSTASETASAISETTTTVEEVRQAAQLSSRKAKNVSDSANRAVQVSEAGQKAVKETTDGINLIREQMDSIAETIIRLSEQGQTIGGIIASVTDLADQSNMLAVNAAIEAAKAGEHGKGFAVVAQEIRSLAEQSKQSTEQIREILNDVQKATNAAVMAAEQGAKAVEAGVRQSKQAGESIISLANSTDDTEQAAIQIVTSSEQQEVGMNQIGVAMEQINQAGIETTTSMKQTEEAAKNLNELGQKLKGMVGKYIL